MFQTSRKGERRLRSAGIGSKDFVFADLMSLRGTGGDALLRAGGTGGHHLRPKVSPRAGVSLAGEHNPGCSLRHRKSIMYPTSSRGPRCVSCNIREIPSKMEFHGFLRRRSRAGASKTAIEARMTRDADLYSENMEASRAELHIIQQAASAPAFCA